MFSISKEQMEEDEGYEAKTKVVCGHEVFVSIDDAIFDHFIQVEKDRIRKLLMSI